MMDATIRPPSEPKANGQDDLVVVLFDLAQRSKLLAVQLCEHHGGCEGDASDTPPLGGAQSQLVQVTERMAIALAELAPHAALGEHTDALVDLQNCVGMITYLLGRAEFDLQVVAECLNDLGDKSATMLVRLTDSAGASRRGIVSS